MLLIQKSARNQMVKEGKQSDYNLQHRSNKKDRQDVVNGKELTDLHINAYQQLIKNRLPNIHGLQDTVLQEVHCTSTKAQQESADHSCEKLTLGGV